MFTPFAGLLYDPERIDDLGAVTSPPYDVISPEERTALEARSEYNIVRVLLGRPGDASYQEAAELLRAWRTSQVLVQDPTPRLYLYEMVYESPAGSTTARGVVGSLDVIDLGDRVIPHEETMAKHRADRLAVLRATEANIDPIIALSSAPELAGLLAGDTRWRVDFTTDGVRHRLADITDPDLVTEIDRIVGAHPVAIADGHHRYTTALRYRDERRAADGSGPWDGIMAMLAPAEGSGLTVGPYHRLFPHVTLDLDAVQEVFEVTASNGIAPSRPGDLVIVTDDGGISLRPRPEGLRGLPAPWREASPAVARELLYPAIGLDEDDAEYEADADTAVQWARAAAGRAAMLVAPVSEHAIAEAGEAGIRFPQKTTYFTPKPRAGLVLRSFT